MEFIHHLFGTCGEHHPSLLLLLNGGPFLVVLGFFKVFKAWVGKMLTLLW